MHDPADIIERKPDYGGGSIVNLISSVIGAAGGRPAYAPLAGLDASALGAARHIVLLVIDGFGSELLRSLDAPALRAGFAQTITSVYPPTTTTAVTALLTGLAPQQHGLTGWFMHFPTLGGVTTVLPFTSRLGKASLTGAGVEPTALFGHTPVFDLVPRRSFSVSPHDIARSPFNRSHSGRAELRPFKTLDELFEAIETIVRTESEPTFTYAYWPHVDRLAHEHGPDADAVREHAAELDRRYARFLDAAAGTSTAVLVTADHGFVGVAPQNVIDLNDHPALKAMLLLPLCGEPRTAYCYVAPGREAAFAERAAAELGHAALCVPSAALVEQGYFGLGAPHPELFARIGHYTLLARPGYALSDRVPGEKPFRQLGVHGGGTTAEIDVPLIAAFL